MNHIQDAPFAVQIELTKGCNLQCTFCGINGFQEKPNSVNEYMEIETARELAAQISKAGWNSRLEFAMHGEPTLNPNWVEIIGIFRNALPKSQIMVTSNGGGIVGKTINETVCSFFKAGGNILAIDEYQGIKLADKIRNGIDEFELDELGVSVYEYPRDKDGNPHRRTNKKFVSFIAPIDVETKGVHSSLNNHCGSGGELDMSMSDKLCAKPFREISINFDGTINLCCNDFIGEFVAGDIMLEDIVDIWNNKYFNSARKFLMNRQRDAIRPCRGCTAKSYRVGLLPDKLGKVTMDKPTREDADNCLEAISQGPQRKPTKRAMENIIPALELDELEYWPN